MIDPVREKEADKYRRMWAVDAYRNFSPGEQALGAFLGYVGSVKGKRVIDFGCGTGRAALSLQGEGAAVVGVDLVREALDPVAVEGLTFHELCLWDLPPDLTCDWGYCTDVMEHIPTDKVADTLQAIRGACGEGCFFQIATFKDGFGRRIGETLHETIAPRAWWGEMLGQFWGSVEVAGTERDARFLCRA